MNPYQTPKSEMVERVAAAIYGANIKHVGWRSAGPGWHRICREQARAAIEAMRPNSFGDLPEAMCLAGSMEAGGTGSYDEVYAIFRAMIDAALKPEGGETP